MFLPKDELDPVASARLDYIHVPAASGEKTNTRRDKRGVIEECCLKPCSTATLKSYCGAAWAMREEPLLQGATSQE